MTDENSASDTHSVVGGGVVPIVDDLGIGVQVTSAFPGVAAVAFVAFVEVVDTDGMIRHVTIDSHGLTPRRRAALLADAGTDAKAEVVALPRSVQSDHGG